MPSDLDITRFAYGTFASIILFISASISSHIVCGHGNLKAKEITFQSMYPQRSITFMMFLAREKDCLDSGKGGKRPQNSDLDIFRNPCFCHKFASCVDNLTGQLIASENCPLDGTASCFQTIGNITDNIGLFISYERNCRSGVGFRCSIDEPCDPCDLSTLLIFNSTRCGACTTQNKGNCNFVPNDGPYCLKEPGSRITIPCKSCCTEFKPIFIGDKCF